MFYKRNVKKINKYFKDVIRHMSSLKSGQNIRISFPWNGPAPINHNNNLYLPATASC